MCVYVCNTHRDNLAIVIIHVTQRCNWLFINQLVIFVLLVELQLLDILQVADLEGGKHIVVDRV